MVRDTLPGRDGQAPAEDRALHRRLVDGEAAALGECYDRFAPVVHGLARAVLGDDPAADRITCEVLARLWEHPEDYDGSGPLRAWLIGLTHRLAVQRLRDARSGAGKRVGVPAAAEQAVRDAGQAAREAEELERSVRDACVAARADHLVTSMPVELRSALELVYFRRRDCRQTAADLGITEDDTRRRLRHGLHVLASAHAAWPAGHPDPGGHGPHTYAADRPGSPA
jgi:RNA polymerase sigma-70 factor (ECF subfamily)